MRIVLVGAVESSIRLLCALAETGHPPLAVVTLPMSKAGRHSDFVDLRPIAAEANIPVIETNEVNAVEIVERLRGLALDYLFVVGWSQIVRPPLLRLPKRGCIGLHPAPLPELRGRAVIPWTILLGRRTTGTTLFWMDEGVDSGDILAQEIFDVATDETAASLIAKHMAALARMLRTVIPALAAGMGPRRPQDHARATYCARRTAVDGLIDWSRDARDVWALIRAVSDPYPGAFTFSSGRKLTVWSAGWVSEAPYVGVPGQVQALGPSGALVACGHGHVELSSVQLEAGVRSPAGKVLKVHERLGLDLVAMWRALGAPRKT
jgi:methionyl-tRNA formyltransferase